MAKIQQQMEERLSARLKVASAREEIVSGFLAMRPMEAATRRQVEIFLRVMTLNEQAGQLKMGHVSDQTPTLLTLLSETEDLHEEFWRLEGQP
jgi:hypothetical protein